MINKVHYPFQHCEALRRLTLLLFFLCSFIGHANSPITRWYQTDPKLDVVVNLDLFVSSDCPHCRKADQFFLALEKKQPWIHVQRHYINQDKASIELFYERLKEQQISNFVVPAMFFCDSYWTGFVDGVTTGKTLFHALDYCRQQIITKGSLTPASSAVLKKWGNASQFRVSQGVSSPMMLLFTTALLDAVSPCSLFTLLALFSFMWLFPGQRRGQCYLGGVFIFTWLLTHFLQQIWSKFYQLASEWRMAIAIVGIILLLFIAKVLKSILKRALELNIVTFLILLLTVFSLALYQYACSFNISLVFLQWINEQSATVTFTWLYLLLYQAIYILPLIFGLGSYIMVFNSSRFVTYQTTFKICGALSLAFIAIILIFCPILVSSTLASIVVFLISILAGWLVTKRRIGHE